MNKNSIIFIVLIILIALGVWKWRQSENTQSVIEQPIAEALYQCDDEKTIAATYYEGPIVEVGAGEMPQPTGSVEVSLDGAAPMKLAQTISASGIRYANTDESFVFWSKGDEALVMRDNQMDLTYTNCRTEQ